jgi:Na+/melibiose symporter and related transporters
MGVQIGFSLQNANSSRIFQSMGADISIINYFWLASPLIGAVIQPIIGAVSDRWWTKFGRRLPFIVGGAAIITTTLFLMPNVNYLFAFAPLIAAAITFLFMDTSLNATAQPFRALVADMVNDEQKTKGYVIQTILINLGAIIGSVLPYILTNWVGLSNETSVDKPVSTSLSVAYYIGGGILLLSVLQTFFTTKEYSPALFAQYSGTPKENNKEKTSILKQIITAPKIIIQLGIVQFFSWGALFLMWSYLTPAVAENVWGTIDANSLEFGEAGNWVGVLNGVYPIPACIFAFFITSIAKKWGNKLVYAISMLAGALGFLGLYLITNQYFLIIPMIGVGIAWAGVLSMPYTILALSVDSKKMGIYIGIFTFSVILPQVFVGAAGGLILSALFAKSAIGMILLAAIFMVIAAISVYFVKEKK